MVRIGLISDTHNLLRPEAPAFLHGGSASARTVELEVPRPG